MHPGTTSMLTLHNFSALALLLFACLSNGLLAMESNPTKKKTARFEENKKSLAVKKTKNWVKPKDDDAEAFLEFIAKDRAKLPSKPKNTDDDDDILNIVPQYIEPKKERASTKNEIKPIPNRAASPLQTTFYSSDKDVRGNENCGYDIVMRSLNELKKDDVCFGTFFRFTDDKLKNLLIEKAKNGVKIHLIISKKHDKQNNKSHDKSFEAAVECAKNGISTYSFNHDGTLLKESLRYAMDLHSKSLSWKRSLPNGEIKYRTWSGSRNATHQAKHNKENMIYSIDRAEYFDSAKEFHSLKKHSHKINDQGEVEEKTLLQMSLGSERPPTPRIRHRLNSLAHDLVGTIVERIKNADNELHIAVYTIKDKDIQDALLQAANNQILKRLIVDHEIFKNNDQIHSFLRSLVKANVKVSVYNPYGTKKNYSYDLIAHEKLLVRIQKDGKKLLGVGSVNFTEMNNKDINHLTFYPNNEEMTKDALAFMDRIEKDSIPYEKIYKKS